MLFSAVRWIDQRFGAAKYIRKNMNKVFPDHWSFMLGEVIMYCFVILLITGAYLTFFFEASAQPVEYHGSYAPLAGTEMSAAYRSALDISFDVRFGLIMRQMHHWAALLFIGAMALHMMRVFFTGAYRKPREINWIIGLNLFILGVVNGFLGYSLLDDLLSGTGMRVGYSILLSIPVVGTTLAGIVFGAGDFPPPSLIPRFYVLHVLLLPAAIAGLMGAHVAMVWYQKHTHFRGPGRTEKNVVGIRFFPTYATNALGLFFLVTGVLSAMGGLAQINPIWKYGPFESGRTGAAVTSGAQPDWYMGMLDGYLRLVPGWETRIEGFYIPNYFWIGVVLPGVLITWAMLWPFIEQRRHKDYAVHNLLDRPRDNPHRTGLGAALFVFLLVGLLAASNDVLGLVFGVAPETITLVLRVLVFAGPIATYYIARHICNELRGTNVHPAAPGPNHMVVRTPDGGYEFAHGTHHDDPADRVYDPDNTNAPPPVSKVGDSQ